MRGIRALAPGLLLGLVVAGTQAGEPQWGPPVAGQVWPSSAAAAGVDLGRPVALAAPSPAAPPSPMVSLGRPLAAAPGAGAWPGMADPQIQPASYSSAMTSLPAPTFRAKADDSQPMPLGAPLKGPPLIETPNDNGPQVGPSLTQPKVFVMAPGAVPPGPVPPGVMLPGPVAPDSLGGPDACCGGNCGGGNCGGDPCCDGACCGNPCCDGVCCGNPCCCNPCDCPGMESHPFWVRGEFLLWGIKDSHVPPLATTGPLASGGILGNGATVIDGGNMRHGDLPGGRLEAGGWLDNDQLLGLEGGAFFIGPQTKTFSAASNGSTLLARPFIDVTGGLPGTESAQLVAGLGTPGSITVSSYSRLYGADLNLLTNLDRTCWYRLDLLGGFRYLQLDESLDINEHLGSPVFDPRSGALTPETVDITDHFGTRNQFYGGQLGLRSEFYWKRWQFDLWGKVALGETHQTVDVNGMGVITPAVGMPIVGQGLLAEPSNIGRFTHDGFSVVPELGANIGYQVTNHLRAFAGYNFLYWSNVVRPEDQIDRHVNTAQNAIFVATPQAVPNPALPAQRFQTTDFWAQGVNIGLEWRW